MRKKNVTLRSPAFVQPTSLIAMYFSAPAPVTLECNANAIHNKWTNICFIYLLAVRFLNTRCYYILPIRAFKVQRIFCPSLPNSASNSLYVSTFHSTILCTQYHCVPHLSAMFSLLFPITASKHAWCLTQSGFQLWSGKHGNIKGIQHDYFLNLFFDEA